MISIECGHLRAIVDAAEAAYPEECCGLLVGHGAGDGTTYITAVRASPNIAEAPRARFEVDPQAILDLRRELRGASEAMVGLYHSHPDHPARPSSHDLAGAFEPDLVWLIVAVEGGQAIQTTAHRLADGGFSEIPLVTRPSESRIEP